MYQSHILRDSILIILSIFAVILVVSSCSNTSLQSNHDFSVSIQNGIEVSVSSGEPRHESGFLEFHRIAQLVQDPQITESLLFRAIGMLVDNDGRFYVIDNGDHRIAVFSPEGVYERDIGKRGSGPGEFQSLIPLWISDDVIAVYDNRLLRTTLFRTDGTLISVRSVPPQGGRPQQLHQLGEEKLLMLDAHQVEEEGGSSEFWIDATNLTTEGDTLGVTSSDRIRIGRWFEFGNGIGSTSIMFGPISLLIYNPSNGLLKYRSDVPELHWLTPAGETRRIMKIELPAEEVTQDEMRVVRQQWDKRVEDARGDQFEGYYKQYRRLLEFANPKAYWSNVLIDDNGFIWLAHHRDVHSESSGPFSLNFRLISPEGEYLGDVTWPTRSSRISMGHILGISENEETGELDYVIYRAESTMPDFAYR